MLVNVIKTQWFDRGFVNLLALCFQFYTPQLSCFCSATLISCQQTQQAAEKAVKELDLLETQRSNRSKHGQNDEAHCLVNWPVYSLLIRKENMISRRSDGLISLFIFWGERGDCVCGNFIRTSKSLNNMDPHYVNKPTEQYGLTYDYVHWTNSPLQEPLLV